jgi:hypothetical protein
MNCLFSKSSRPSPESTQPPIQWVPGVRLQEREANHSPLANSEVKKTWVYISTPPYAFMVYCLLKNRDNLFFFTKIMIYIFRMIHLVCTNIAIGIFYFFSRVSWCRTEARSRTRPLCTFSSPRSEWSPYLNLTARFAEKTILQSFSLSCKRSGR